MLRELIENYKPYNMQEREDKKVMMTYLNTFKDCLTRKNALGHFTSSAFIVNEDYTKVLMAYHNIYKSYAWLGGHVDGCEDTLKVAIKEANEESSIKNLELLSDNIISLDVIEVQGHFKKGNWVTPHVHLNVTYLFKANDKDFIKNKEDENSSVAWIPIKELDKYVSEENILPIYQKIIEKMRKLL